MHVEVTRGEGPRHSTAILAHDLGIGDAVHMLPAIQMLAHMHPASRVWITCHPFWQPLIERMDTGGRVIMETIVPPALIGWVDRHRAGFRKIISVRDWCYDHDEATEGKPTLNRIEQFFEIVGCPHGVALLYAPFPYRWTLGSSREERHAPGVCSPVPRRCEISALFAFGSNSKRREYPHKINIPGSLRVGTAPGEWKCRTIDELIRLILVSRVVIGCDSGVVSLAAALGVPTVGLFGPTTGEIVLGQFRTWSDNPAVVIVQAGEQSGCNAPCNFQRARGFKVEGQCEEIETTPCMQSISESDILRAMNEALSLADRQLSNEATQAIGA